MFLNYLNSIENMQDRLMKYSINLFHLVVVVGVHSFIDERGNTVMHDEVDDGTQIEWCRKWSEKKMQKKIKRVQHWCNFKIYLKYAWHEFKAAIKGR